MYKLLSIYSVIKPPKTGNCQILNSEVPKISIDDIKNIYDTDGISIYDYYHKNYSNLS